MNDIDTLVPEPHTPTPWRRVHRATAIGVGGFAVVHLAHHLCALGGIEVHLAAAAVLRRVYRHPWLEPVLLLAVAMQWFTGAILVARRLRRQGTRLPCGVWLRWSAGLVMSVFLPVHVLSVLRGRSQGIDTNFYFAAAGLHDPATATPFALYYGLGVAAVCVHLGVAACRTRAERRWPVIMLTALVCATVLVLLLAGRIHPFSMPGPHRDSTANAAP